MTRWSVDHGEGLYTFWFARNGLDLTQKSIDCGWGLIPYEQMVIKMVIPHKGRTIAGDMTPPTIGSNISNAENQEDDGSHT